MLLALITDHLNVSLLHQDLLSPGWWTLSLLNINAALCNGKETGSGAQQRASGGLL